MTTSAMSPIYIGLPRLQTGKQRPERFTRLHQTGVGVTRYPAPTTALTSARLRRTLRFHAGDLRGNPWADETACGGFSGQREIPPVYRHRQRASIHAARRVESPTDFTTRQRGGNHRYVCPANRA